IKDPFKVIQNAHQHLQSQGQLIIVLNHPCFRIPRQSSWGVDPEKHLQFRRVDRYFSALEIPILTHPSQKELSSKTFSYHYPLSSYSKWLQEAGFVMESIEEWCSDKKSVGKTARMENRSRQEFPLFLAFSARKA
ncbi:MAG: SAM-dependent methyltransferase, partial [Anaerolineae bacterium]